MTLILGLHLTRKLYLVSDTRATEQTKSGIYYVKDDLLKVFMINKMISAVACGNALPASYILTRLSELSNQNTTIDDLKTIINTKLHSIIADYVNKTGRTFEHIALLIAGFNPAKKKIINSSKLGEAMSAALVSLGEGSKINQSIPNEIINALISKLEQKGHIEKDEPLELESPSTNILSVTIDIRTNQFSVDNVDPYGCAIYHPKTKKIEKIELPQKLLSLLDFGDRSQQKTSEDSLYYDAEKLMSFVNNAVVTNGLFTVGGHIVTLLVSPEGSIYPTGDLATAKDGKIVYSGTFFVNESGRICYKLKDGVIREYRDLLSINKKTNLEIM